jgi:hypothetical protein
MPQFNSRRSSFWDGGADLADERVSDKIVAPFPFSAWNARPGEAAMTTPIQTSTPHDATFQILPQATNGSVPGRLRAKTGIGGVQQMPVPTQSLVVALQATLERDAPIRKPVLIPGTLKRPANVPVKRKIFFPRWQLGFLLTAMLFFMALSLLSLMPVSHSQGARESMLQQALHLFASQGNSSIASIDAQKQLEQQQQAQTSSSIELSTSEYVQVARDAAVRCGIPPDAFVNQIQTESGFNPNAVSPVGAIGIAQFMPSTAAGLGIDPWDPVQALNGAACFMAQLAASYDGNYAMGLAAYNAGSGNVNNALNNCGDAWLSCLPAETQNYVARIMGW